jgi:hypothetical protein
MYLLTVNGGFDSSTYPANQEFIFTISDVKNPKTTRETGSFTAEIFTSTLLLQYSYTGISQAIKAYPSPFSFASISPGSTLVGAFSMYTFILTVSIDTDANSYV